jgi:hypothetical protein
MALGPTTYKTTNIINQIGEDLTSMEGCGLYLFSVNLVRLATTAVDVPYAVVVTGTDSLTPGTYPSAIGDASLELVDQLGCCVQVLISTQYNVKAGDFLLIDTIDATGTFVSAGNQLVSAGDWIWGYALTDADAGEQCLMRFQPFQVQYVAP